MAVAPATCFENRRLPPQVPIQLIAESERDAKIPFRRDAMAHDEIVQSWLSSTFVVNRMVLAFKFQKRMTIRRSTSG